MRVDRFIATAKRIAGVLVATLIVTLGSVPSHASTQSNSQRIPRTIIRGGMVVAAEPEPMSDVAPDSLALDTLARDTLSMEVEMISPDSLALDSLAAERVQGDLLSDLAQVSTTPREKVERTRYFSDSMSLSKVCWTATALPGFGQVYNKQYWKLPILYGSLATGILLYTNETKHYKPLKAEYDELTYGVTDRSEYLNEVQGAMIRSNTRRQLYLGATIASYIYFLGDAAINYSTNDVSDVKRATTLATICPGAGQIYNKQYWKVPFVVGGFASMIYVVDWNNRGYQRFKKAYNLIKAYEADPDAFPDGSPDEFGGRYSASYMDSLRDSYRRNRDLSIIMLVALYGLQIIDAHVDAHFQDYDISDDLAMTIEPAVGYAYSPTIGGNSVNYGFNIGIKF